MSIVRLLPPFLHQVEFREHVLLFALHLGYLILLEFYPLVHLLHLFLEAISFLLQPLHYDLTNDYDTNYRVIIKSPIKNLN